MTKRIFRCICVVAIGVFVACCLLFLLALYDYFGGVQKSQLQVQAQLVAQAVSHEGMGYLDNLDTGDCRITLIGADGTVLYDNRSSTDSMENHLERDEIRQALLVGTGESSRYSDTLDQQYLYCARRMPDGSVLRLAVAQSSLLGLLAGMVPPICAILAIAVALSLLLAARLSKRIVGPLNALDLGHPLSNEGYDELSPLLHRIDNQQQQIRAQELELARKREEFEAVTRNMTEGIMLLSPTGTVLGINHAAQRLFGVEDSCIGQDLFSVNRSAGVWSLLAQAGAGKRAEQTLDLAGGRYQLILNPVVNDGRVSGVVLLAIDATEKERAERMRREFTANVSHELKTPLHTIAGSAELLANGIVKEQDKPAFYERIQNETQRMIRLVEDIIWLSQLDEGAGVVRERAVDLWQIVQDAVEHLRPKACEAQVELRAKGQPAPLRGDAHLLQGIVENLCDNAIKYNHAGGSVDVAVEAGDDGGAVLRVSDTGIGIASQHQQRVFERFYRVDKSRSKQQGGTGLGLSIVKHAARLHGAKVELRSAEGKGTTVTVVFPSCAT